MNETELTLVVAGALLVSMLIGWTLRWFFARLNRSVNDTSLGSNELAARLHTAEEARDAAVREREEAVKDLKNRLDQAEAELGATMDGLRFARQETEALRSQLDGA